MTSHIWHIATHGRPTFCNICREALSGVTSSGYSCGICKYKVHKSCASNVVVTCKWTTLNTVDETCLSTLNGISHMHHQWIEGNLPVASRCAVCDKTCGSVIRLQDWRCLWCRVCVHSTCRASFVQNCSFGETRSATVPPTCLIKHEDTSTWHVINPLPGSPLVVFVNSKSGGGHGDKFLRRFKQILNPGQVFDLSQDGPTLGLQAYKHLAPLRLLICGGDGSVGWVLKEIDKLHMKAERVCVSVLPLGTGNDLARVCGWGPAIEDDVNLTHLIEKYEVGSPRLLDRWSIMSVESQNARKDDNVGAEMEDPDEADRGTTPCEGYLFLKEDFSSVSSTSDMHTEYLPQGNVVTVSSAPSLQVITISNAKKKEILQEKFMHKSKLQNTAPLLDRDEEQVILRLLERARKAHEILSRKSLNNLEENIKSKEANPTKNIQSTSDSNLETAKLELAEHMRSYENDVEYLDKKDENLSDMDGDIVENGDKSCQKSVLATQGECYSSDPKETLPYISELMKDLSTMKEGIDLRNTTEATELIIQIKSMIDAGTTQVKFDVNLLANNLKKLEKILEDSLKNQRTLSTKVGIEECKDKSQHLQKDFPPVFDDVSIVVPKVDKFLKTQDQKGSSISTIMSDENSCQSSVSILITDTTNIIPCANKDETLDQDILNVGDKTERNNEEVSHKEDIANDGTEKGVTKERPISINSIPFQKQSMPSNENSQVDETLLELPSPISRHGSLVGDPQLPVPTEFLDSSPNPSESEEAKDQLIEDDNASSTMKVEHSRLAIPSTSKGYNSSKQRHSTSSISLLKSIPEATGNGASEIETAENVNAPEIPTSVASRELPPRAPLKSFGSTPSSSMSLLEVTGPKGPSARSASLQPPHEIEDETDMLLFNRRQSDIIGRRGSRRLSVGALAGMSVLNLDSTKGSYSMSGSNSKIGGLRIRNKAIPIINPLVKNPNWPSTIAPHKKDLDRAVNRGLVSMVVLASADALCAPVTPIMDWIPPPDKMKERSVMNNYFGIGIDAKIALDFHNKREETQNKSGKSSRAKNYMWYGMLGSRELVQKTYKNLEKRVILECDGESIPLPSLQGIVVLNISSFMGGTNFWGNTKDDGVFLPSSFDDGILEVVAVFGSMHMGASRIMNLQRHRIAQCRSIVIRILGNEGVPVQVDGEAWLHPPGIIRILHKNRVQLMCRDKGMEQQVKTGTTPRTLYREHAHTVLLPLDEEESHLLRSLISAAKQFYHYLSIIHHALDGQEAAELITIGSALNESLSTVTPDGIQSLSAPELRRRSAVIVNRLRLCIASCKTILVDKFQETQSDAAGKLSQSIYIVESLLGKCHEEGDLLFFTIRSETNESGRRNSWFKVPRFGRQQPNMNNSLGNPTFSFSNIGNLGASSYGSSRFASVDSYIGASSMASHSATSDAYCSVEIVSQWSPSAVSQWLEAIGLPMYAYAFLEHEISGLELLALEKSDFKDVGVSKVGHIKRLQHGIRDIQSGKLPRRLLHPTCGVMSQKVDSVSSMISTTSTYSRMSQSSACSSSYHGAGGLTVPPCDLPHIQISNTDMDDSNLGISSEEVFDPGAQIPPRNHH